MTNKEISNFKRYLDLRVRVKDTQTLIWESLNDKIIELMKTTEEITPDVSENIKEAYDILSQGIIPSIFPTDFPISKDFKELQSIENELLRYIPHALKDMFLKLFKGYLKNSCKNASEPDDSLHNLLEKFNRENIEIRYQNVQNNPYTTRSRRNNNQNNPYTTRSRRNNNQNNPYTTRSRRNNNQSMDWRKKAKNELYEYYGGVIDVLNNMRNFQTHKEEPFFSGMFDLAKRKLSEPISGIDHPGNYITLANLVIFSVYEFIEILQVWIDTQVRIGKI